MDKASFNFLQENVASSHYLPRFRGVSTRAILDVTPRVCRCADDEVSHNKASAAPPGWMQR